MTGFQLPYGRECVELQVPDECVAGVLQSRLKDYQRPDDCEALVREALAHPVGTARLSELARGRHSIVVISSDHTRPVPSRILMPLLLEEIRRGNPQADITILISTGLHRTTTPQELREKFGDAICENERIIVHDCDDKENLVDMGVLPSGGRFAINRLAAEADLLVAEGFIEPHFFAGFSGGRKSVLPGVASRETVMYNHNAAFIDNIRARTGNLEGNPIHADMLHAARVAQLAFILNVVIDAEHLPVFAVAGECEQAHRKGCEFLLSQCAVDAVPADIVVSTNGGYPLDQNLYQAVKGMTAAEATVREGGVIVMLSRCADGVGGEGFFRTFRDEKDLTRMMRDFLARGPLETIADQWQSQILARVLLRARVILVSECDEETVRQMHMIPASDVQTALAMAQEMIGRPDAAVTVIPDGVSVIVRPQG